MTNNEIIFNAVSASFTPDQLAQLVSAVYTAEQISRRRDSIKVYVSEDSTDTPENIINATLAAETFHTFAEWKNLGYTVRKGQHAALVVDLWKYTDKPGRACREAAAETGKDAPDHDPHFYKAKSHLFSVLQCEKLKS